MVTGGPHQVLADRYRLTDAIGRGGMADVYAAEDTQSGRMVAVKVMRVGEASDPERFAAEMRILERLSHPAIVRLFDTGRTPDDSPYFVMQLIEGESMAMRLREEGPLPEQDLIKVARRVAGALAHAHGRGVVHRDIKPANILIDDSGRGYLTDFGVARLVDSTLVTRTGTTIGTAAYLAPEQLQDSAVGPAADVYSLGLVLIESFTGRRAFRGRGVEAAMARLGRDPAIPEDLPDNWRGLLLTMTRRDPARRPSAAVVEAVLRGRQPPPPLDPDELAARAAPVVPGDDVATAITPMTGEGHSGAWEPPSEHSAGDRHVSPSALPAQPPTPPLTPPPVSVADGPAPPRGMDAIRSRALLVGTILGALLVLLSIATILTLRLGNDDPVVGRAPVDDATRDLLAVLEAAETLRANDPNLDRDLRVRSGEIVRGVNDEDWTMALQAVIGMTEVIREGIDRTDINDVVVTGLLESLRTLTAEIQHEITPPPTPTEESALRTR